MSTITISLSDKRFAPWGIFRKAYVARAIKSIPVIWLTEDLPEVEIEKEALLPSELQNLISAAQYGYILVSGMDIPPLVPMTAPTLTQTPVSPIANILDVTSLFLKEEEIIKESAVPRGVVYPQIDELLSKPAATVKKEIKSLAKKGVSISFLNECRSKEENGKARKTILSLLLDLTKEMVASVGVDSRVDKMSGRSLLSETYYSLIDESDDEEEELA